MCQEFANDLAHITECVADTILPGKGQGCRFARMDLVDVLLNPLLKLQPADDSAAHYGNDNAAGDVEEGYLPAKETPEHDECHFIHHGCGYEEREGDA